MDCIKNDNCNLCSLGVSPKTERVCHMPAEQKHYPIMVIGEKPSMEDIKTDSFISSKLFDLVASEVVNIKLEDVYKSYVLKCFNREDTYTEQVPNTCFNSLSIAEIEAVQPKVIILFGEAVFNTVLGETGITKNRGKVYEKTFGSHTVKVIPTFSPAHVEKAENNLKLFAEDLQHAQQLATGYVPKDTKTKLIVCDTLDKVNRLMDYCEQVGKAAFDYETTGLEYFLPSFKLTCLSISFNHGSGYVIPLWHREPIFDEAGKKVIDSEKPVFTEKELEYIVNTLQRRFFGNINIQKVAHNLKFDLHCCRTVGITEFRGRYDDTMLMHHVLNGKLRHGLKEITDEYYRDFSGYEDETKKYKWDAMPKKILFPYSAVDTDVTLRLSVLFEHYLLEDERSYVLYRNHSMPTCFALERAEYMGMKIDREFTMKSIEEVDALIVTKEKKLKSFKQVKRFEDYKRTQYLEEKLFTLEAALKKAEEKFKPESKTVLNCKEKIANLKYGQVQVYEGINFASPKQMEELLYSQYGFSFKKKMDKFNRKEIGGTGKDVLQDIKDNTGFIGELLVLRSIEKMNGTYIKGIWERCDANAFVHTELKQIGTYTGRLSSANPNLQNLPTVGKLKDEIAKSVVAKVKKMFSVPKDHTLIQVDFSQAELRTIAYFGKVKAMLEAYMNNVDLHKKTGCKLAGITLAQFDEELAPRQKEIRNNAKPVNFGFIYGMSAEGFVEYAKNNYGLIIDLATATKYRNDFFDEYPELLQYHEIYKAKAKKFGYVRTLFGRRIFTPEIYSSDQYSVGEAERQAINSPIQGTSGEWCLFAIALLQHRLSPLVNFVNTVHDSIILYCPDNILDQTIAMVKQTCEQLPTKLYFDKQMETVDMKVDVEISTVSWKDLQEYEYPEAA